MKGIGNVRQHDCSCSRNDCQNKLDQRVGTIVKSGNIAADHCPQHGFVQNKVNLSRNLRNEKSNRRFKVSKRMKFLKINFDKRFFDIWPQGKISAENRNRKNEDVNPCIICIFDKYKNHGCRRKLDHGVSQNRLLEIFKSHIEP